MYTLRNFGSWQMDNKHATAAGSMLSHSDPQAGRHVEERHGSGVGPAVRRKTADLRD